MDEARAPNYELAYEDYKNGMKYKQIAEKYGVSLSAVKSWASRYWKKEGGCNQKKSQPKKVATRGGQPGNKNAVGHGAPVGNNNAEKFGFFRKYLPEETVSIIQEMPKDPLDILWDQIQIAYAAIIRAQKIMYVKDNKDSTTTKIEEKYGNVIGERWEVQHAWDKQGNFLSAQARAQKTLEGMIAKYEELIHKNWELATEEQKARIAQIKAQTDKLTGNNQEIEDMNEIEGEIYGQGS